MTWDIIIWENNSIDFVPSSWANESKTLYKFPNSKSDKYVRKLIYCCNDLENDFKWCSAKLKLGGVKSLQKAKDYCLKGQYTSNIDSSENEEATPISRSGRPLKKARLSDSSVTSNESSPRQLESIGREENRTNTSSKYLYLRLFMFVSTFSVVAITIRYISTVAFKKLKFFCANMCTIVSNAIS